MKATFVLDENVFIQSHTCKNISDHEDNYFSLELIISILYRCHNIGLSPKLAEVYWQKLKTLEESKKIDPVCTKVWRNLLSRQDKCRYSDNHLNDLPNNVLHDRHVIEPAFFLSGVLVTTDERLKERLNNWATEVHRNLRVMSPVDALAHVYSLGYEP